MKAKQVETANRYSLSSQVADSILARIASGQILPGERVIEAKIAEEFGVSSIPVREAIRELAAKGVLEYVMHKGARVREVSMSETIDALEVKGVLEALAARLGGERLSDQAAKLRKSIGPIGDSLRKHDHFRFQQLNQNFHRIIVETAGNSILLRLWDYLGFDVRTRAIMDYMMITDPEEQVREHQDIVDAIESGDKARVASLLSTHSDHIVRHLQEQMSRNAEKARK
jgi:DNA-binding GntR family transcriptional regulator